VVVFIGGALDDWNRNLLRVFCAYDAEWERTRKLYFLHTEDITEVRRQVLERAAGAPIVLIGHSYGANFAYELANGMADDGGVRLLLTLDPVSGPGGPPAPPARGTTSRRSPAIRATAPARPAGIRSPAPRPSAPRPPGARAR
jgi:pimeloyl-ACP methyl ester carboxylesterase